ncbi:endonuclease III domain-containing protein [Desulfohalobium retbaense]|uniref:HhH-GPD family protein n=1 Tax=Desulfohalobium retbaense (strain ATCC 49708 / DSM 5692 / JCM 16813 / HR100) TaxID=485915 RepID=C8X4U4_DESRD|nr:endonuclease [Desulfohalobium retbaense]ACV69441.1 HhH-GPD family protein [Desulfohalobium retbaense DSM 5692]
MQSRQTYLLNMHAAMLDALGPSHWWPGETPFEIVLGAILTQNTNWENVRRALNALRAQNLLSAPALAALDTEELAALIRPAGYYRVKAGRIKNFLRFFEHEAGFDFTVLQALPTPEIRERLLGVNGIGPETADSIALYALDKPTFVVDTYTARIFGRHGQIPEEISYADLQAYFTEALPEDTALFNEFHAQIVRVGKHWCKKKQPQCHRCPLEPFLPL